MSSPAFFDSDHVSRVFYINLNRSADRRERIEQMGKEIGIDLTRIEGCDGAALPQPQLDDITRRIKIDKVPVDGEWHRRAVDDQLIPDGIAVPPEIRKTAAGIYGCQASHLRALKAAREAIGDMPETDQQKWVIVLEDDALLKPEDREQMNAALADAPDDAGALLLVASHRFDLGSVPIETDHEHWAKPVHVNCTMGIAYRKEMLDILIPLYERNLAMRREEGGILPVDGVNWVVQQSLLGMRPYLGRPEHRTLARAFERLSEGKGQKAFYLLNPGLISQAKASESIIGSEALLETKLLSGTKLQTFPQEIAIRMHELFASIPAENMHLRTLCKKAVADGCLYSSLLEQWENPLPPYDHEATLSTAIAAFHEMTDPAHVLRLLKENIAPDMEMEDAAHIVLACVHGADQDAAERLVPFIRNGQDKEILEMLGAILPSPEEAEARIRDIMGTHPPEPALSRMKAISPQETLDTVETIIERWQQEHGRFDHQRRIIPAVSVPTAHSPGR